MKTLALQIQAQCENLSLIRGVVRQAATRLGFSSKAVYHIVQATDEACANVICHVYKKNENKNNIISLKIDSYKNKIIIHIRDYGRKINPQKWKGRELNKVKPGGLGLHLIHGCMDEVCVNHHLKKGTALTLIKYLKGSQE